MRINFLGEWIGLGGFKLSTQSTGSADMGMAS